MVFIVCLLNRVPFQQALQLIAARAVYLEAGLAYVPFQRLVSIITTRVSTNKHPINTQ